MTSVDNVVLKDKHRVLAGSLSGCAKDFSEQNSKVLK